MVGKIVLCGTLIFTFILYSKFDFDLEKKESCVSQEMYVPL